mmetsp:Transcript_24833/g.65456  ORF Transcript_24833/g.65456 Transcript_24833/m.65456 type:complete len:368 (+) Transcript_24833:108-1211(+)
MAAAELTNTLWVHFGPEGGPVSVASAYEALAPFGEVARLELPPGLYNTAVVSFYDLRSAVRAMEALGDRCEQGEQYGDRTVSMPGDVQLLPWMVPEISAVRQEGAGAYYSLDFYDTRTKERVAALLEASAPALPPSGLPPGLPPGLPVPGSLGRPEFLTVPPALASAEDGNTPGGVRGPRYRTDLLLSKVSWDELASGLEQRTTLRLRCLPSRLCDEGALRGVLAQAGLSESVDCLRMFPGEGKRPGSALINAVSTERVAPVAKLFHGRQWGASLPVSVSFAAVQGRAEVCKAYPERPPCLPEGPGKPRAAPAAEHAPRRIEVGERCVGNTVEPCASEVSTEAGDASNSPRMERIGCSPSSSAVGPK